MAGARDLFHRVQLADRAGAGSEAAHDLEHVDDGDVLVVEAAGQDRAAVDEDAGDVEPEHRHHHAGQRLVATREADQRVVAVAANRQLDRVRDDLAADERRLHALVAHGDAVGDGDGVEAARHAAVLLHTLACGIRLDIEQRVARRTVITRAGERDKGAIDLLFGQTHRVIIAAVRRAFGADRDVAARQPGLVEAIGHGTPLWRGGRGRCKPVDAIRRRPAPWRRRPS